MLTFGISNRLVHPLNQQRLFVNLVPERYRQYSDFEMRISLRLAALILTFVNWSNASLRAISFSFDNGFTHRQAL